jgi:hypothetical protein
MAAKTLQILDAHNLIIADNVGAPQVANLLLQDTLHRIQTYFPYLTDNGGSHKNTIPTTYNNEVYLKCRHLHMDI